MYSRCPPPNPVFENNQDTYILANVLRSAGLMTDPEQEALPLFTICSSVIESVGSIVHNSSQQQAWDENLGVIELQEKKISTGRRMHAMSLFSLLRVWKISCPEADAYYESVTYNHVTLTWKFYLCIGHQSQWSEFFIECARQLSPKVLAIICENILGLALDEKRTFYSYHILLQSIIWKFFILEDPTILTKKDNLETHRFNFPFTIPNSASETIEVQVDDASTSELLKVYGTLLNKMFAYAESGIQSFEFVKLVLHAYKLIFKLLRRVKTCEGEFVKEVFRLNPLLKQCIHDDKPYKMLKSFLEVENVCCVKDPCNKLASWKININYLVFLVCTYWEEVEQMTTQSDTCLSKITPLLPCAGDRNGLVENSFLVKDIFKDSNSEVMDLLKAVIQYRYPCAVKAAEVILSHLEVLTSNVIIGLLEDNIQILCGWKNYVSLMNAIVKIEVKEAKLRLLNLFYSVLSHGPFNMYNEVLKYIVKTWGYNETFKLPDFNIQLTQFTRKTHTYEEAKASLLPLFVQSPLTVLETVVQQALMRGPGGMVLIRVLKDIPVVCNEPCSMNPLLSEISGYFIRNSHPLEELKNMELLIQTLMEVHAEENFLSFDLFLRCCFLPTLSLANMKLELTLSCLNAALKVLNRTNAVSVSDSVMMNYLTTCSRLLTASLRSGSGKVKELIVQGLNLMHEHFKTGRTLDGGTVVRLHAELEKWDPAVFVYMNQFVGQRTYEALRSAPLEMSDLLWMWCCFTKDEELLQECISQEKFSYEKLLNILVKVPRVLRASRNFDPSKKMKEISCYVLHNHFTMEEWVQSTHFIKDYCQHLHSSIVPSTMPWQLSENSFHLYATIRCLTSCLYFILDRNVITEIYYISSCFTNTVMNLLNNQDVQPELLLYIFIDMCHLSLAVEEDILTIFSTFLIGIIKNIYSVCKDQSQQKHYVQLFLHAVQCLPDSDEKASLLEKFY